LVAVLTIAAASLLYSQDAGKPKPKSPFEETRAKLLGRIPPSQPEAFESAPNVQGDYVYEATSAKPLVDGIPFKLEKDSFAKGLTTVTAGAYAPEGSPRFGGVYWRIKGVQAGNYWLGVVFKTGAGPNGEEVSLNQSAFDVYLNGREVPCSTLSDPVQIAPGIWFAEAQAAAAESLKEGDEIAVRVNSDWVGIAPTARLLLHASQPARGAYRFRINPGPNIHNGDTALRITADAAFAAAPGKPIYGTLFWCVNAHPQQWMETPDDFLRGPDGKAVAKCSLANPLPVPVEVDYDCVVKGHYLQEAGRDAARLTLPAHSCTTRNISFETTPDDPAYSISVNVKPTKTPSLGWPAFDEFAFFPGYRQLMPWIAPFECVEHRRVNFKQAAKCERQRLALFGEWQLALTRDLKPPMPPPPGLAFKPWAIPSAFCENGDPNANSAYVRRKFTLPDGPAGRFTQLVVDSVDSEATAYVNGQRIGNVRGYGTPLVADATAAVHPGENEVLLLVRSRYGVGNPQYINWENPTDDIAGHMDAPGSVDVKLGVGQNWGGARGVWLELSPAVSSRDLKVETSVRNKTIAARFSVVNAQKEPAHLRVKVTVQDARRPIRTLGEQELALKPGESKPVELTQEWLDPKLWSWNEPNLYVMAVELTDADTGKRLDLARERFGFRESWIQGGQLYFNGHPVRLKGLSAPFLSLDQNIKYDVQLGRGARDPDYADEIGELTTDLITGVTNSVCQYNIESDAFWEACRNNAQVAVRREWNHPSVIAWDLSNEWFNGVDLAIKRFKGVSDTVEKLDPTRWTFFNGDGDISGRHNIYSSHYMLGGRRISGGGYELNGHSAYFPDGAYYRPLDRDFQPSEDIKYLRWRVGSKPMTDTEDLWMVGGDLPPGCCKFMDEEGVLTTDFSAGMLWRFKQDFDGQRDLDLAIHSNHDMLAGTVTRGHPLRMFLIPDVSHHGFAGRKMVRPHSLLNDLFRPAKLTLKWAFVGPEGNVIDQGAENRDMNSGQTQRGSISFTLPAVTQRTKCVLQLRLESDEKFVYGEDRDIEVWPDTPILVGEMTRKVALYDPKGDTAKAMKEAGATFELAQTLAAPSGEASGWVLVIGEGALEDTATHHQQMAALAKFVEDGGRIVVLAQTVQPHGLPASTTMENREWVSQPYVRLPIHPVLEGVTSWDLHFWAADRVSARGSYSKPDGGAAIAIVDSGRETGLEWVQLMEMYRGKGLYLLCQLALVGKYDQEPMARELLARVLRYAGGKEPFRRPLNHLRLMAAKNGQIERRLKDVGVAYEPVSADADLDRNSPTLVEAATASGDAKRAAWKASLSNGATLVVTDARPEDAAWLSDLAGATVTVTVPRYRMWEGRGYRNGFDVLTAGLSHLDLFWKRYDEMTMTTDNPDYAIEQLQNASVEVAGGRELVFPGALVEVNVGKGKLVLDQRLWTTVNEKLANLADRNLSALALGLNVAVAPPTPAKTLPAEIAYRPVDLAPCANRSLGDDVAEDGKGGWSDQGPDADLRTFPTGKQVFHDVPFTIGSGAKSIIVLASESRPGKETLPWEVTVPVGCAVEGLYFLHGTAYCSSGQAGLYQVKYADGTTEDIPLIVGRNIRDWVDNNTGGFDHERGTRTVAAWTGKCKAFPSITAYMTLWVNPQPQKSVVSVRFSTPTRKPVVGLIGLTAVVSKGAGEPASQLAQAQELLKQAQQALKASKSDEAKALLKRAIVASPSLMEAHQALADLCEKDGKEDEILEAYRQWTHAGALTTTPWNRLGEILERRKDFKGALEAYKQSLKINWNQPAAIEAKSRLEKLIGH
jgi:hypothetical protein